MSNSHLVILKKPYLEAILSGRKTIESRFIKSRRPPFGRVAAGDRLFFKVSSGAVCAIGRAKKVMQLDSLTGKQMRQIKLDYNDRIIGSNQYWAEKRNCKYGLLVWLEGVTPIEPIWINKKDWRAWVVLTEEKNFGLFDSAG